MCGICGIKGVAPDTLEREQQQMLAALLHRGPDDQGRYCDQEGGVFLGAVRLSIVDLTSAGAQPIFNEDKTVALVCNGEIYNASLLREGLRHRGHRFSSKTDIEVIVHLYEELGERCLEQLTGMFALALWDQRKGSLLIARDRLGIKPLYYYADSHVVAFASEAKALLKLPFISREIDLEALDLYFALEYVPAPHSIYKGIRKLKPGCYLLCEDAQCREGSFWDMDRNRGALGDMSFQEAGERLEGLLSRAVRDHLMADVPVGFFLSGGFDSSVLVALARPYLSGTCHTFSVGFTEGTFDESRYAREVSAYFSTQHHHLMVGLQDFLDVFPSVTAGLDEPLGDMSIFPTYLLSRFSRTHVKAALSGEGADELFMGYPTYLAHRYMDDHKITAGLVSVLGNTLARCFPVKFEYFSTGFKLRQFLRGAPMQNPALRHMAWMGSYLQAERACLYSPALKQGLAGAAEDSFQRLFVGDEAQGLMRKVQRLDVASYLADDLLVKADRASMAASLEVRVPYLDHALMEFVRGLPMPFVFQKRLFKSVMGKCLPKGIAGRKKHGFAIPFAQWLKDKKSRALFRDYLDEAHISRQGLFDPRYITRMVAEHVAQKADHRKKLGTYLMFQAWHQNHMGVGA